MRQDDSEVAEYAHGMLFVCVGYDQLQRCIEVYAARRSIARTTCSEVALLKRKHVLALPRHLPACCLLTSDSTPRKRPEEDDQVSERQLGEWKHKRHMRDHLKHA
jgi:hypothetical protein